MRAKSPLSPNGVKWSLLPYRWIDFPFALCVGIGVSQCSDVPDSTLQYRGGSLYVCVDASQEDKCYKVEDKHPLPKDTVTPE